MILLEGRCENCGKLAQLYNFLRYTCHGYRLEHDCSACIDRLT